MDDITYSKAYCLQNKLCSLATNKKILSNSKEVSRIILQEDNNPQDYKILEGEYLDFNKIKTILLQEINKQIEIAQKEFDEL